MQLEIEANQTIIMQIYSTDNSNRQMGKCGMVLISYVFDIGISLSPPTSHQGRSAMLRKFCLPVRFFSRNTFFIDILVKQTLFFSVDLSSLNSSSFSDYQLFPTSPRINRSTLHLLRPVQRCQKSYRAECQNYEFDNPFPARSHRSE